MKLSAIVVVGKNREIGCNNKLLWNLPADMARFKKLTAGRSVIMGDRTFESIGAPLPGRNNIVISLNKGYQAPGCTVVHTIEDSIECAKKQSNHSHDPHSRLRDVSEANDDQAFVIGGATIYKLFMPLIDKLYITEVDDAPKADTYFPDYSEFKQTLSEEAHEDKGLKFVFKELSRQ